MKEVAFTEGRLYSVGLHEGSVITWSQNCTYKLEFPLTLGTLGTRHSLCRSSSCSSSADCLVTPETLLRLSCVLLACLVNNEASPSRTLAWRKLVHARRSASCALDFELASARDCVTELH